MRLLQNLSLLFFTLTNVFSQPSFVSVDVQPALQIEWDQTPFTFYTGQSLNLSWTSQGFAPTDFAKITYPGVGGTRTLTTGSGVLVNASSYKVRLSDASNMVASNVPVTLTSTTNASLLMNSAQTISVIQSKLLNIVPLDGNRTLGGGQNAVCDNRNLTVTWRGLGEAQFGVATITLAKASGSPGTLGTALTNVPVSGNMSVSIFCPRTSVPSTFNPYQFQISVVEAGGTAYTANSASFNVAVAPTPTPSPTPTPTSSRTPTSSNTPTPSPSATPSPTRTPTSSPSATSSVTPSITPTQTPTPSTTETARPSIDYAAIGRAAASQVDTTTPAIAGALGGIGGVLVLIGALKWYQNQQMTKRRLKKLQMTSRFVQEAHATYGIQPSLEEGPTQPSIVMYSVQGLPSRSTESLKKGFAPKPIASK